MVCRQMIYMAQRAPPRPRWVWRGGAIKGQCVTSSGKETSGAVGTEVARKGHFQLQQQSVSILYGHVVVSLCQSGGGGRKVHHVPRGQLTAMLARVVDLPEMFNYQPLVVCLHLHQLCISRSLSSGLMYLRGRVGLSSSKAWRVWCGLVGRRGRRPPQSRSQQPRMQRMEYSVSGGDRRPP